MLSVNASITSTTDYFFAWNISYLENLFPNPGVLSHK